MAEQRMCLMTVYDGRADSQSLAELNRLLDEGWRISGIDPTLHRAAWRGQLQGVRRGTDETS